MLVAAPLTPLTCQARRENRTEWLRSRRERTVRTEAIKEDGREEREREKNQISKFPLLSF